MISDDEKRRACMLLYSALVQDKVDFSTGKVTYELSSDQVNYLKRLLHSASHSGMLDNQLTTVFRGIQLAYAVQMKVAQSSLDNLGKSDAKIFRELDEYYGLKGGRTKKAYLKYQKIFYESDQSLRALAASQLPDIDFTKKKELGL